MANAPENFAVMTEKQAADYLKVKVRTVQAWRYRGGGPQYVRGSSKYVRYRKEDVDQWLQERITSSTSELTEAEKALSDG